MSNIPDDEWLKKAMAHADTSNQTEYSIPEYIHEIAKNEKVPPYLFEALCRAESDLNPWAVRFEPGYRYFHYPREWAEKMKTTLATEQAFQATSWGLAQVMGGVAREHGFAEPLHRLAEPDLGLTYGARHLRKFYEKYGQEIDAVSSYNQGSPRKTPGGLYYNQTYVDRVYRIYRQITPMRDLH